MTFYNTTSERGAQLAKYRGRSDSQEQELLTFFRESVAASWSPSELHVAVFRQGIPITSVRRALTNLANEGLLVKLSKKSKGLYGRPEHRWTRPTKPKQTELDL